MLQTFILKEINITVSIEKIHEVYHYATNLIFYSSVIIKDEDRKKEFYDEFNKQVISLLGLSHQIDSSKLFDYFKERGQHWILKKGVDILLAELKSNGCFISLVSNFDTRLYDILNNMKISNYFDSIFISQEVGLEKPNIEFFRLALIKHNIEAKNSYLIGDSYNLDYLPGIELNIKTYLLDENNFYPTVEHRVSSLDEFKTIIINEGNNE